MINKIVIASFFVWTTVFLMGCTNIPDVKVEIPRFPHNTETQTLRELSVMYSPDDISASTTLAEMGYPNNDLFLLHREHPQLKITMQTIPANRYVAPSFRDITKAQEQASSGPCCKTLWKMIIDDAGLNSWQEIGNHGYTHSPPEDSNLDHHEFSSAQSGCNFEHSLAQYIRLL